jgi:DNA modification methylase
MDSKNFKKHKDPAIHSWYPYFIGFSDEFVQKYIHKYNLNETNKILDPFAGVGTTLIVAKKNKIPSIGVEINPLISFIANTKLHWKYNQKELHSEFLKLKDKEKLFVYSNNHISCPDLLKKRFLKKDLQKLFFLKEKINKIQNKHIKNFFLLALVSILKNIYYLDSSSQKNITKKNKNVFTIFLKKTKEMMSEIPTINKNTFSKVYIKDARNLNFLKNKKNKFDLVISSPPYLNNWNYNLINKIEFLFLDFAKTEKTLYSKINEKLLVTSTAMQKNHKQTIFKIPDDKIIEKLNEIIIKLNKNKICCKNYSFVIVEYFNDIYKVLKEVYKMLNKNGHVVWIIGNVGLYNTYIPNDEFICEIARKIGFKLEKIEILSTRKIKKIKIKESVIILKK